MHIKLFVTIVAALSLIAYVAPIPEYCAAEVNSNLSEEMNKTSLNLLPDGPVPINIHDTYRDSSGYKSLDVVGIGLLKGKDMYVNMTIRARTYNDAMVPVTDITTDSKIILPRFDEMRASLASATQDSKSSGAANEFVPAYQDWGTFTTYYWRNALCVARPGNDRTWVAYDHPDNYYTYHREQWNLDWSMYDSPSRTTMIHYGVHQFMDLTNPLSILTAILGSMATIILAVTKLVLLGIVLAALALLGIGILAFLLLVVISERGDGWGYVCGPGYWPYTNWWWVSFGLWRDIWWIAYY